MAQDSAASNADHDSRLARFAINDCEFSIRTMNRLQAAGHYKTLADLDAESDDRLLRIPHFGSKCLREVRETIKAVRFGHLRPDEEVIAWVVEHQTLVRALMRGEAVITPVSKGAA